MKRPARISWWPPAMAVIWMTTPTMKTLVEIKIPYFREAASATKPDMMAPNQAPSSKMAVSHPFFVGLLTYPSVSSPCQHKQAVKFWLRTLSKRWHLQDTAEHALVVSIKHTTKAGEHGNQENLAILDESSWTTLAHQGLAPLECDIEADCSSTSTSHDDSQYSKYAGCLREGRNKDV